MNHAGPGIPFSVPTHGDRAGPKSTVERGEFFADFYGCFWLYPQGMVLSFCSIFFNYFSSLLTMLSLYTVDLMSSTGLNFNNSEQKKT
jgi:hypothetical protein